MYKTGLALSIAIALIPTYSQAESPYFSLQDGDGFKRFSISFGALHVMPQGQAQPFRVNTAVKEAEKANVGSIQAQTVLNNLRPKSDVNPLLKATLEGLAAINAPVPASLSGTAELHGLSQWNNAGTGLEADEVSTLGIMSNYYFTDHVSLEVKAGIPPKVDLKGQGKIYAPFSAIATPIGAALGQLELENNILITDLGAQGATASARAWTPAFELQYHFGKTGVNKFRPYVGLGVMYAYFNELEMNTRIEQDLIAAGHMIANIKQGHAGASLEGKTSSANPQVELEASEAFAPIATIGFSYDYNERWFAVGSLSYAQLRNDTTITVTDAKLGKLIRSKADIEINPILAYAGMGYRF
jgi:outer membrane protein W